MAENEDSTSSKSSAAASNRPTIVLPPRTSMDSLFCGSGFSPGPMTLVSSFFSDSDDCKSFSQLLAGAMASPAVSAVRSSSFSEESDSINGGGGGGGESGGGDFQFKQSRPAGLVVAQQSMFTVPAGLSPASLLDSPGFFATTQGPFGMTHKQALAQVTAQASQGHSKMHNQAEYSSSMTQLTTSFTNNTSTTADQQMQPSIADSRVAVKETSDLSYSDQRSQRSTYSVDKPVDDGYNWRKYGQKQVKGSEFPRSYYRCTYPKCLVTKKVERSLEGQVTEIIYKGQHNHQRPQSKRSRDTGNLSLHTNNQGNPEYASQEKVHQSGSSDSEEAEDTETSVDEKDEDEPNPRRRTMEVRVSEAGSSHRTVTKPKIIVQTTSEVDLLDDGYRWRKYGQKVVKGNPYPRSYYKCTTPGCNVRKHVERASTDCKAVITTYEGKHNHDVPAAKSRSHNIASSSASQLKSHTAVIKKYTLTKKTEFESNDQQRVGRLRLKEENIT